MCACYLLSRRASPFGSSSSCHSPARPTQPISPVEVLTSASLVLAGCPQYPRISVGPIVPAPVPQRLHHQGRRRPVRARPARREPVGHGPRTWHTPATPPAKTPGHPRTSPDPGSAPAGRNQPPPPSALVAPRSARNSHRTPVGKPRLPASRGRHPQRPPEPGTGGHGCPPTLSGSPGQPADRSPPTRALERRASRRNPGSLRFPASHEFLPGTGRGRASPAQKSRLTEAAVRTFRSYVPPERLSGDRCK